MGERNTPKVLNSGFFTAQFEVEDIVAFLHTLTGRMPSFEVPALP